MKRNVMFALSCGLIIFICFLISKYVSVKVDGYIELFEKIDQVKTDTILREKIASLSSRNPRLPLYYGSITVLFLFTRFYINNNKISISIFILSVVAVLYLLVFVNVISVENLYIYTLMPISVLLSYLISRHQLKKSNLSIT